MTLDQINNNQYNRMLKKYGQTVTDAYSGAEYKVIFQKQNAKNMQEKIKLTYQQDYPLKKGSIIKFKDMYFLIISRDGFESNAFHTSIALKCQSHWFIKGEEYYLITGDLSSPNPKNGSMASTVSGNICLYTKASSMMTINEYVIDFDGWYKCVNTYTVDGITYYYYQRSVGTISCNPEIVPLNSKRNFDTSDEQASLACYYKGVTNSSSNNVYIPDARCSYTSSDTTKATVDQNGIVTFLSAGNVNITASYGSSSEVMSLVITGETVDPTDPPEPTPTVEKTSSIAFCGVNADDELDEDVTCNQYCQIGQTSYLIGRLYDNGERISVTSDLSWTVKLCDADRVGLTDDEIATIEGYVHNSYYDSYDDILVIHPSKANSVVEKTFTATVSLNGEYVSTFDFIVYGYTVPEPAPEPITWTLSTIYPDLYVHGYAQTITATPSATTDTHPDWHILIEDEELVSEVDDSCTDPNLRFIDEYINNVTPKTLDEYITITFDNENNTMTFKCDNVNFALYKVTVGVWDAAKTYESKGDMVIRR